MTAAIAMLAARSGRRVLAIALTDRLGLAAHLRAEPPEYEPARVRDGLYLSAVDRSRALDEYLKLQLRVPQAAPTKQLSRALNVLVDTAPGVREIVSIGKPIYEVWKDEWDLVVVDAPPTGQIASYLRAPETIRDLVPAGAVQSQAQKLTATLTSGDTGLVLVTTPGELPVLETLDTIRRLARSAAVPGPDVIVNRVIVPIDLDAATVDGLPPGPARDAAALHTQLVAGQREWTGTFPDAPHLPFLFGLITPGEVAARLSDLLEEVWS